jgi:hypothetical protein
MGLFRSIRSHAQPNQTKAKALMKLIRLKNHGVPVSFYKWNKELFLIYQINIKKDISLLVFKIRMSKHGFTTGLRRHSVSEGHLPAEKNVSSEKFVGGFWRS